MTDFVVVGGGIAGAAAGYFLSEHGRVTLLEAEDVPGRHSTGRSAALFSEYYGNATVRTLTASSRHFFEHPPSGFCDAALLRRRGVLVLAGREEDPEFARALELGSQTSEGVRELSVAEARFMYPVLRADGFERALLRLGACDIDVASVHQGFLRGIRRNGGEIQLNARVRSVQRRRECWMVGTASGEVQAPVLVNAAGAWAEELAQAAGLAPMGLISRRRTLALVPSPQGHRVGDWPMLTDLRGTFYAKPEPGGLLVCPEDDTPTPPGDPRPEDLDVAVAIARYEAVTTQPVTSVIASWAGLRTAAPDDTPIVTESADGPGFFWLAGLSGYGIQLAPAVGRLLASLVTGVREADSDAGLLASGSPARTAKWSIPVPS